MIRKFVLLAFVTILVACGGGAPGPLGGTWQSTSGFPMTITFRNGETEALGLIEKVDYKVEGKTVFVTYKDGLMKGTSVRFSMVNPTTAHAMGTTYRKVGN